MNYSTKLEKKVIITTYQPTAQSLLLLLQEHKDSTDTELSEWRVDIECKMNEVTNTMSWQDKYRWEVTLTRSIK